MPHVVNGGLIDFQDNINRGVPEYAQPYMAAGMIPVPGMAAPAMLAGALLRLCREPAVEAPSVPEWFDPTGPEAAARSRAAAQAVLDVDAELETESVPAVSRSGR